MSMDESRIKVKYLSAGTNRFTAVADWHCDGQLAFGADNNVCVWRPNNSDPRGINRILSGHTAPVRTVRFLPKTQDEELLCLVSGGDDEHIRIWGLGGENGSEPLSSEALHAHSGGVNCVAALSAPVGVSSRRIFASGAADATVKIWELDAGRATLLQTLKTTRGYIPLAIALSPLGEDGNGFVMAVAGTTNVIQVFAATLKEAGLEFELQATLSGHENWIRSMDFTFEKTGPGSDLILASASQDKYIRLWRIHQGTTLTALSATGPNIKMEALMPGNKIHKLKAGSLSYCVMFEALLLGHEDWIYSARWNRSPGGKLQLLSSSADNSLSVWEADQDSGIWITTARLGEISREKGATTATGSIGGFWTGLWSPSGTKVVTLGRTGGWRRWDFSEADDRWVQNIAISGHTRAVTGISWARNGAYLLSTSSDQTTRLHAEWKTKGTWHEMARPQIHGYDLNCIDSLGDSSFVSGADEKLMRVFTEPKAVARMLSRLTGTGTSESQLETLPDAANMPVLGLSNKAVVVIDDDAENQDRVSADTEDTKSKKHDIDADRDALDPASAVRKSVLEIDRPPFEESLSRHTLWPEVEKLYGHGYELSCLAASHDGRLIASACRASSVNHAVIRLFETSPRWTEVRPPLMAHSLTVARLRFSTDDKYLLSVGRDRQWAVFEREADVGADGQRPGSFKLLQSNPKAHSRMLLDAAWAPCEKPDVFATAGRDKQLKIWTRKEATGTFDLGLGVADEHPVTALDFLPHRVGDGKLVLAVGTEAGRLFVVSLKVDGEGVTLSSRINVGQGLCLHKPVLQLAWQPSAVTDVGEQGEDDRNLAIAGEDGTLRIYSFML